MYKKIFTLIVFLVTFLIVQKSVFGEDCSFSKELFDVNVNCKDYKEKVEETIKLYVKKMKTIETDLNNNKTACIPKTLFSIIKKRFCLLKPDGKKIKC